MSRRMPTQRLAQTRSALIAGFALLASCSVPAQVADPIVFQFSTVGDTRGALGTASLTAAPGSPLFAQDGIWGDNTKVFSRIIRTVQSQRSNFLFVNGDLIVGYGDALPTVTAAGVAVADVTKSDIMAFYKQYGFWRGLAATAMETGTYVVPVPGNHETQWSHKVGTPAVTVKTAMVENETAWRANMADLILDQPRLGTLFPDWNATASNFSQYTVNATTPAVDTQITTDQSSLTYSFDFRGIHFAVINTDATGWDSHAPVAWLAADLAAAQTRGAKNFFVFGHKPAYTYDYSVNFSPVGTAVTGGGMDGVDDTATCGSATCIRDQFWALIEQYKATYFCGHEHTYNSQQPTALLGGSAYQVLVGGGGSAFDPQPVAPVVDTKASDRMFSWATVQVRQSGAVNMTVYGFDPSFGPTKVIEQIALPH